MNVTDTDLRDALEPLAGDPIQDAARVLDRLPGPGIPPITWWLLAVGLAVGGFVGFLARGSAPAPVESQPPASADKDNKKPPYPEMGGILFFGLGGVSVKEPNQELQTLDSQWHVAFGSRFETGSSLAGMLLPDEVMIRLDHETIATMPEQRRLELAKGQSWVAVPADPPRLFVVDTPLGMVDVTGGAANIRVDADALEVVCLTGSAEIRSRAGTSVKLAAGQMASLDPDGLGEARDAGFLFAHTRWMTRLIVLQQDRQELTGRIKNMIDYYFGEEYRSEAIHELRRLGSSSVPLLVEALTSRTNVDPGVVRATARMIGDMAEISTVPHLFTLLYHVDPEVRVIAYTNIYRITDENAGSGDAFWRDQTNREERESVIQEWWRKIR